MDGDSWGDLLQICDKDRGYDIRKDWIQIKEPLLGQVLVDLREAGLEVLLNDQQVLMKLGELVVVHVPVL